ncbi:MAG: hypothetical protein KY457_10205 [Actinobacteria bacterium]|nr:hypothetical protein [Actinomycetota bacterium]
MSRPAGWRPALCGLLLVAATACVGGGRTGDGPDPHLLVDVERSRSAAGRGVLEVRLRTEAGEPFEVIRLQLLDDRFTVVPPAEKSTPVRAGGVGIVTPIPAGDVVCDAPRGEGPRMAVTVATDAGTADLVVPVSAAGDEVLTDLHADACRRRDLLEAVEVAFGDDWTTTSPATAEGTITLDRGAATEEVVLEAVHGTVIFTLTVLAPVPEVVLTLPEGESHAEVAVEVSAARCDPHALIESKKTYLFPLWVRAGDDEAIFLTVEPTGAARTAFEALLAEGCHLEDAGA